jgi:hypothetical protein
MGSIKGGTLDKVQSAVWRWAGHMAKGTALVLGLATAPTFAAVVYYPVPGPYYYGPAYRMVDTLPPSGAALGPWKWNFNFGGGPTPVLNGSQNGLTNGWNFSVGTGYNFTPRAGFVVEFMNGGLGVTDQEIQQNQAVDGSAHVWSVTLNPIYRFRIGGPVGGYLIGGGGFYERDTDYTVPGQVFIPDGFGGGVLVPGFVDTHQVDDTGGVNVGAGITCNLGWGTKLFAEVRYHYIFTAGEPTQILPITFGFRW